MTVKKDIMYTMQDYQNRVDGQYLTKSSVVVCCCIVVLRPRCKHRRSCWDSQLNHTFPGQA